MKKMKMGFTLIELIMVTIILGVLVAVAIPRYMTMQSNAEASGEDAVINAIVSGLEIYANEKLIDSGRRVWPSNPFEALEKTPTGYNSLDSDNANADDEWTFNTSNNTITHMRKENSSYYWSYDPGSNSASPISDCWSGDYSNHGELMAAVDNGYVVATQSANSESQCGEGETFFWCQQPGSSTDNFDYCGSNGYCPVNDVNGTACCYCGGCLITVCPSSSPSNDAVGAGIGTRTAI